MYLHEQEHTDCLERCVLTQALGGLCVGFVLTDAAGRVAWLNRAAQRVLGAAESEAVGVPLRSLLRDLQLQAFWDDAVRSEGNTLGEISVNYPEPLALKVNATRYVDAGGAEAGRALLFCDVTAEKQVRVTLSNEVATRLLDLTSSHMPPRAPKPVANLTHQEVRILRLVGSGMSNDEIAEEMSISASTVRTHLKSTYRKLGLNSRAEAVSYAVRNKLV
jgi:DNA-binding CsgD family transcriptional regulator